MTSTPQLENANCALPKEYFWREYTCPLGGQMFLAVAVKSGTYSVRSREPDFRPLYDGPNPLHYAVIVSPGGFAAEEPVFRRSAQLLFRDRPGLAALVEAQPPPVEFSGLRGLPMVCRAYELALSCSGFLRVPRAEVAGLALRASWVNKELVESGAGVGDDQVHVLRGIALGLYLEAYEQEDVTQLKLGSAGVAYLIAELLRERGRFDESLRWFSRVVQEKSGSSEILRLARNQVELCREQRQQAKKSGTYKPPKTERQTERSMYQLYRDQVRFLTAAADGAGLSQSAILRGVLDGLIGSGIDFRPFATEEDLAKWIAKRLKA